MPELPEVETTLLGLAKIMAGRKIARAEVRRRDLRWPLPKDFSAQLEGKSLVGFSRRAKYMLIELSGGSIWIVHLGMSGRMSMIEAAQSKDPGKHDHVIVTLISSRHPREGGDPASRGSAKKTLSPADAGGLDSRLRGNDELIYIAFNDPRRFGMMDVVAANEIARHKLLKHLGFEPLEKDFTGAALYEKLRGKKKIAIKLAIMDQRLVVGVGNIYASEALYYAKISPKRRAASLTKPECARLAAAIKKVLRKAIKAGGSSLRDYVQSDGTLGNFQEQFAVYGRAGKPCPTCKTDLKKIVQGGRATFYCPDCQK